MSSKNSSINIEKKELYGIIIRKQYSKGKVHMTSIKGKVLNSVLHNTIDKLVGEGSEILQEIIEDGKLQRILLHSFEEYQELEKINNNKMESECYIDKDAILSIDAQMIMPNLTPKQLEKNLSTVFLKCIKTDNEYKVSRIRECICLNYLEGVRDFITISQVDEDIHKVHNNINQQGKEIKELIDKTSNHVKMTSEEVRELNRKIQKLPQQQLIFISELDWSRVYCYISLQLTTDIDNNYLEKISKHISAKCKQYKDENGLTNVSFYFEEPIVQKGLKVYLEFIDDEFSENEIGILSITSHF